MTLSFFIEIPPHNHSLPRVAIPAALRIVAGKLFVGIAPLFLGEERKIAPNLIIGRILRRDARQVKFKILIEEIFGEFQRCVTTRLHMERIPAKCALIEVHVGELKQK